MSSEDPRKARTYEDARIKRPPSEFSNPLPPPDVTAADLGEFFTTRPLLVGEDESTYDGLLANTIATTRPADAIKMIWVRNIVDLIWEAQRLRRWKTALLATARLRVLQTTIKVSPALMAQWQAGDPVALKAVEAKLEQQGLTWDAVMSQVLLSNLIEFEQIERMIASTDARWERALCNIARRREGLAQCLRQATGHARVNQPDCL